MCSFREKSFWFGWKLLCGSNRKSPTKVHVWTYSFLGHLTSFAVLFSRYMMHQFVTRVSPLCRMLRVFESYKVSPLLSVLCYSSLTLSISYSFPGVHRGFPSACLALDIMLTTSSSSMDHFHTAPYVWSVICKLSSTHHFRQLVPFHIATPAARHSSLRTSRGWVLTQVNLDIISSTALKIHPFFLSGQPNRINIYYQHQSSNLTLASYYKGAGNSNEGERSPLVTNFADLVKHSDSVQANQFTLTQIMACLLRQRPRTWTQDYELWVEQLSLSSRRIEVDTWYCIHNSLRKILSPDFFTGSAL
jgi:hypothetical protein